MQCPSCNTVNPATSVKCIQCDTILIPEALSHNEAATKAVEKINNRMHYGYGALIGGAIGFLLTVLFPGDPAETKIVIIIGAVVGGALGKYIAWKSSQLI